MPSFDKGAFNSGEILVSVGSAASHRLNDDKNGEEERISDQMGGKELVECMDRAGACTFTPSFDEDRMSEKVDADVGAEGKQEFRRSTTVMESETVQFSLHQDDDDDMLGVRKGAFNSVEISKLNGGAAFLQHNDDKDGEDECQSDEARSAMHGPRGCRHFPAYVPDFDMFRLKKLCRELGLHMCSGAIGCRDGSVALTQRHGAW
jgi:hypothetical protein